MWFPIPQLWVAQYAEWAPALNLESSALEGQQGPHHTVGPRTRQQHVSLSSALSSAKAVVTRRLAVSIKQRESLVPQQKPLVSGGVCERQGTLGLEAGTATGRREFCRKELLGDHSGSFSSLPEPLAASTAWHFAHRLLLAFFPPR